MFIRACWWKKILRLENIYQQRWLKNCSKALCFQTTPFESQEALTSPSQSTNLDTETARMSNWRGKLSTVLWREPLLTRI